jgi:16S rRNA (cytosine967-C5)-methyltransferase
MKPAAGSGASSRADAAKILNACSEFPYRTLDRLFSSSNSDPMVRDLVYGCVRHYFTLIAQIDSRLTKPLPKKHRVLKDLMIVGAYQLLYGDVPVHAAVNETVSACGLLECSWAKGLVNAVLRDIDRNRTAIQEQDERSFDMPEWLILQLRDEYPGRLNELAAGFRARPPMTLRINLGRVTRDNYTGRLDRLDMAWNSGWLPETVTLQQPIPQTRLPGYEDGLVSVQDAGAQFAAALLAIAPEHSVLDACAAPGGKLFHLLEQQPDAEFTAIELSQERAERISSEANRLGVANRFHLIISDSRTESWWSGQRFDRILLDAPCTGVGTLRRHPDIKLHRDARDVEVAARLQTELLTALWPKLGTGGRLLYCTCSILSAENEAVIEQFLSTHPDAEPIAIHLPTGFPTKHGWQLLPDDVRTDGFYYSLLNKTDVRL